MNYIFTDYECMKFNVLSHQTIGSCLIDNSKRDHIRQAKVSLQPKKIVMHEPIYYKCHTKYWWKQIILFAPHHLLFQVKSVARKVIHRFYSSFFSLFGECKTIFKSQHTFLVVLKTVLSQQYCLKIFDAVLLTENNFSWSLDQKKCVLT